MYYVLVLYIGSILYNTCYIIQLYIIRENYTVNCVIISR